VRDGRTILGFLGLTARKIHNHQNADWAAGADVRTHATDGAGFSTHSVEVKRQIGVVPEGMGLFERLTGAEYLNFVGRMYGLDHSTTLQRTRELLEFMQLADRPKSMIADYSHACRKSWRWLRQ